MKRDKNLFLVVCAENQLDWAMTLGVPVVVCPYKNDRPTPAYEMGGAFEQGLESVTAIVDITWSLRPDGIIHIGAMTLQEAQLPTLLAVELMTSISVSSLMAKTLGVPFVYLTPGGDGDTPSTAKGAQGIISEDLVGTNQLIVQVNGLFGPNIENQVKRWVYSEKLTVDDTRMVNPVHENVLRGILSEYAGNPLERSRVIRIGGPETTWYEFFVDAGLTSALPWTDPHSKPKAREYRWEWYRGAIMRDASPRLLEWYYAVHT